MSNPTMEVIVVAEDEQARDALLDDEHASLWDEDECQIKIGNVYYAAEAVGGGVHLHRHDSDNDLIYPDPFRRDPLMDGEARKNKVEPAIDIISARFPTEDDN